MRDRSREDVRERERERDCLHERSHVDPWMLSDRFRVNVALMSQVPEQDHVDPLELCDRVFTII